MPRIVRSSPQEYGIRVPGHVQVAGKRCFRDRCFLHRKNWIDSSQRRDVLLTRFAFHEAFQSVVSVLAARRLLALAFYAIFIANSGRSAASAVSGSGLSWLLRPSSLWFVFFVINIIWSSYWIHLINQATDLKQFRFRWSQRKHLIWAFCHFGWRFNH